MSHIQFFKLILHYHCRLSVIDMHVHFIKFLINVTNCNTHSKIIISFNTQDFFFNYVEYHSFSFTGIINLERSAINIFS